MLSIEDISQFQRSQNVKYSINDTMGKCSLYNVIILNAKDRVYSYILIHTPTYSYILVEKNTAKGKASKHKGWYLGRVG